MPFRSEPYKQLDSHIANLAVTANLRPLWRTTSCETLLRNRQTLHDERSLRRKRADGKALRVPPETAERGEVYLAGPTLNVNNPYGIYVWQAESLEEARALMEADPSIKAGIQIIEEIVEVRLSLNPTQGSQD